MTLISVFIFFFFFRSKSLSRLRERHSDPSQSSFYYEHGNPVTRTKRVARSNSSSPVRQFVRYDEEITTSKATTITADPFNMKQRHDDWRKSGDRAGAERNDRNVGQIDRQPLSRRKASDQQNLRKAHHMPYESSSAFSEELLQERANCLDELTPADSDGMCNELQRGLFFGFVVVIHPISTTLAISVSGFPKTTGERRVPLFRCTWYLGIIAHLR